MAKKIQGEDGKTYVEKKPFYKRVWFWIVIVILIFAIAGSMGNGSSTTSSSSNSSEESNVPTSYTSALHKAKTYSDTIHMSKQGIYDQLTSDAGDKYTQEEAQYAIDNIENHISDEDSDDEDTDDEYDIVTRSNVMDIVEDYEGSTLDTDTYTYREPEKRDDGSWGFAFYTKDGELAGSYIVDEDGIVTKYDEDGVEE